MRELITDPLERLEVIEAKIDVISRNADRIYVREQVDGEFQTVALTELPGAVAVRHVIRFLTEGARIKDAGDRVILNP